MRARIFRHRTPWLAGAIWVVTVLAPPPLTRMVRADVGSEPCPLDGEPGEHVHRVETLDDLRRACREAGPGHTLSFRRAEIDLTGFELPIDLPDGITLQGDRQGRRRGSMLFVTDDFDWGERQSDRPGSYPKVRVFRARDASGITIRDLRFRGPFDTSKEDVPKVTAIHLQRARDVRIEGSEFFHWSGQPVLAEDEYVAIDDQNKDDEIALAEHMREACNAVAGDHRGDGYPIVIRDSFFHDNRRQGAGYGVNVSKGARVAIEGNVFERNRHAVASDGNVPASYRAVDNFVLSGGDKYRYGAAGDVWSQHFDVHGVGKLKRRYGLPGVWGIRAGSDTGYGGVAGDRFEFIANTVRGEQEYARGLATRPVLTLRGRPCKPVVFSGNVVAHEEDEAIKVATHADASKAFAPKIEKVGNRYDSDAADELIVADVNGDGYDDLVVMTGAGWYYSDSGLTEWRHLRRERGTRDETLVGDFNCDGEADAIVRRSNGGWTLFASFSGRMSRLGSSEEPLAQLRVGDFDGDGCDDVFRAKDDRWEVRHGGAPPWQRLNESVFGVSKLGFADFDGDGRTDVFRAGDGRWWISSGGAGKWQELGPKRSRLGSPSRWTFADLDADGRADVILKPDAPAHVGPGPGSFRRSSRLWLVAHDGTQPWQAFLRAVPPDAVFGHFQRPAVHGLSGRGERRDRDGRGPRERAGARQDHERGDERVRGDGDRRDRDGRTAVRSDRHRRDRDERTVARRDRDERMRRDRGRGDRPRAARERRSAGIRGAMPLAYGPQRHFVIWTDPLGDPETHSWHPMR